MSNRPYRPTKERIEAIHHQVEGEARGDAFGRFSANAASWLGSRWAFIGAVLIVLGWAVSGPFFRYSNNWQLVINTGTTIVTFLMVFLIQNTQDRMMHIEDLSDEELDELQLRYQNIREECVRREDPSAKDTAQITENPSAKL